MEFDKSCPQCGYVNNGEVWYCESCGVQIQFDPDTPEAFDLEFREGSASYNFDANATTERSNPVNIIEKLANWVWVLLLIGVLFIILRSCGGLQLLTPFART